MSLLRPRDEGQRWVSLMLLTLAIYLALFVTMAVIPSWWLYFADGTLKWTRKFTIPLGVRTLVLPQQALRDLIVVTWYGLMLTVVGLLIGRYNRRHPRVLPAGEEKREATGGYK